MAARRHHTVPQFDLRNFANEVEQVVLVDRNDLTRGHKSSIRRAAAEIRFYRIETEDLARDEDRAAHDPESVESALSLLEAEMAPAVQMLADGRFDEFTEAHGYRRSSSWPCRASEVTAGRNGFMATVTQLMRDEILSNLDDERRRTCSLATEKPHGQ